MRGHVMDHRHRPEVIINQGWDQMRWEIWNSAAIIAVPWQSHIIDTSDLSPTEVAAEVHSWIKAHVGS